MSRLEHGLALEGRVRSEVDSLNWRVLTLLYVSGKADGWGERLAVGVGPTVDRGSLPIIALTALVLGRRGGIGDIEKR